jgi:hypothetical protein
MYFDQNAYLRQDEAEKGHNQQCNKLVAPEYFADCPDPLKVMRQYVHHLGCRYREQGYRSSKSARAM